MWPIVPMFTCGFERSNFSFAIRKQNLLFRNLALDLAHDLFGDTAGNFFVLPKVHGEAAAALRPGTELGRVAEHFRKRNHRLDDLRGAAKLHTFDTSAPRVQVADHVSHVLLGDNNFDGHNGLEQHRLGALDGLFDCQRAGDLEGHFRRVDVVVAAVVQSHPDIRHGEACQDAALERLPDTHFGRLDELARNPAARDVVDEFEAAAGEWLDPNLHVTVLTVTAGLLDVATFAFGVLADGFAIRNLRLADVGADAEFAHHAVHDDLEVQFAHSRKNGLTGFGVGGHAERGSL